MKYLRNFALACSIAISALNISADEFEFPEMPDSLTTVNERADYLMLHYWDTMNAVQMSTISEGMLEQAFVNYIDLYSYTSGDDAIKKAFDQLVYKASANQDFFNLISELAEKYLYTTESVLDNEDIYAIFLKSINDKGNISLKDKLKNEYTLEQIGKCRPGTKAPDIMVKTSDGKSHHLSKLADGKMAILIFYDHDCNDCRDLLIYLMGDIYEYDCLNNGSVRVILVDTALYDSDIKDPIPNWIWTSASFDDIDDSYVVRSFPSIYVLSEDMEIMLKDSTYDTLKLGLKKMQQAITGSDGLQDN